MLFQAPDKSPRDPASSDNPDLEITVMPHEEQPTDHSAGAPPGAANISLLGWLKKTRLIWISVLLGLLLIGGGYLTYSKFFSGEQKPKSEQVPNIVVPKPVADGNLDSDNDGLPDKQEVARGTNPRKADTDGDGLADGDEVNIYQSDPLLPDTDTDGYDDGREVAGGYSPISKSPDKASPPELQGWVERIGKFGLHEPTKTTLKLRSSVLPEQKNTYENQTFGYSVDLPAAVTYREADEKRNVGIYIAGTTPPDLDVSTDPISVALAVKVENQTLADWVHSQYQPQDYAQEQEVQWVFDKGIQLSGVKGEVCQQTKTFFLFPGRGLVIIFTLTCSDSSDMAAIYEQILKSFRFTHELFL